MLEFLRKNSVKIVYAIVISFVVTTFMGVVFFNNSFKQSSNIGRMQNDVNSAIAMIGELPVSRELFFLELRRLQSQLPQSTPITNSISEMLQLNALSRAIENRLLIEASQTQKVSVSRSEINTALFSVMEQFGVSNKDDLKKAIFDSGGSYDDMIRQLKTDIMASKTKQAILNSVNLTELDIEKSRYKYRLLELFVSNRSTSNVVLDDQVVYDRAMKIRNKISDSTTFAQEVGVQRQVPAKTITPRWVTLNQLQPDLARAVYSMNLQEISQPIRTMTGYFIIELSGMNELSVTQQVGEDKLRNDWRDNVFYGYLFQRQNNREIRILDPGLNALKYKSEGRIDEAIDAYQGVISQNPASPYPNLLIAQLCLSKGDIAAAKQWLLKGEIKESLLSETIVLPEIHVMLAEIYNQEGLLTKRDSKYDKLIKDSNKNMALLTYLKDVFEKSQDNSRLKKVNKLIEQAKVSENVIEEAKELSRQGNNAFFDELKVTKNIEN
jgi:parvulin-like peptidyl-prolyl isomerase